MKQVIFWSIISVLFACSCKQNVESSNSQSIPLPPVVEGGLLTSIDTVRLTRIDSMVHTIDTTANKSGAEVTLNPNAYSEKDNIRYYKKDGVLWRVVVVFYKENFENRSVFYWKDGKPIFVRHREWHKYPGPNPHSKEVLTFFEDGKVVAICDRQAALQPNQPPSVLYPVPLQISKRSLEEVVKEYSQYRDPALKAIEEYETKGMHKPDSSKLQPQTEPTAPSNN